MRNARYGLRGVRVGGANHPGPTRLRDEDEVLDNLELSLTMIDSDDEPLTRVAHSRRDGQVGEVCRGHHQAAPQSTVDDSDVGVPDAFVGTPSMLVSCPEPHVGFSAPRKKLRIRQVRESQASRVVAVESSEPSLYPVPRMPNNVDSVSPQVQVEPAGSQVVGFAMGRFAAFAAEAEDDGVLVGEGAHPPGPTQWDTDAEFSIGSQPSEFFSRSHAESNRDRFERVHMEGHAWQANTGDNCSRECVRCVGIRFDTGRFR